MMKLYIICFMIMTFAASGITGRESDIGGFDISRVRTAAFRGNDTSVESSSVPVTHKESAAALLFRIMLYLGVVIVIIAATAWFVKRIGLKNPHVGGGSMDIVETLPVGQNRNLIMVRVGDEIYFLSQTPTTITLLDKISGQKALDIIASSKGGGTMLHFRDALNNFMGRIKRTS